jgi:hypothetical protein
MRHDDHTRTLVMQDLVGKTIRSVALCKDATSTPRGPLRDHWRVHFEDGSGLCVVLASELESGDAFQPSNVGAASGEPGEAD